ncbi:MAG: bi-domain-containing oxidoreductase [Bacteroidia bacterium]|nr:bi-domain-containing oxidoreductase [Bacteroidia bacterium]
MQQLTQLLKDGTMKITEVPFPALQPGWIMVRNHFSVISAGTEGKTVKDARLGYIGKARARKAEVKKVMDAMRTYGIRDTYRMVMNKLDAPSALGYSSAGEIIAVAHDVTGLKVGDYVACGGASACHAEVISVPVNLCVKINKQIPLDEAAFVTIGSIAMQGVRQAGLQLGESCAVIGLGLIGRITMQLLQVAGVNAIGIDVSATAVEETNSMLPGSSFNRNDESLEKTIQHLTRGIGCDAVIITAGSNSEDPVNLAGALCRQKGKVVIVGAVPTGFERKNYYVKELELRMSCSYGPGRYDDEYELHGVDYPAGYVRWTENRNMEAFAQLLNQKKIDMKPLISHRFRFENAADAYQMILDRKESFSGIVLEYDLKREIKTSVKIESHSSSPSPVKAGLIGAGSFAQNFLLPALDGLAHFEAVATARSNNAINIATKYGFAKATGNADEVISDKNVNTVFIVTRHDTHAGYVRQCLAENKNVYVEKPLCLSEHELEEIKNLYINSSSSLMLGFNRRFAPMTELIKSKLNPAVPVSILYRINAGQVSPEHWIHNPQIGGGRIIGEVCHFIDLCTFLAGSPITSISAQAIQDPLQLNDTLNVSLYLKNGSIATIAYFSNGNKEVSKEYLEVYSQGWVAVMDDFRELTLYGKKKTNEKGNQDKGHKNQIKQFIKSIEKGKPSPIPFEEIYHSTLATFKVLESIKLNGALVELS